MEQFTIEVKKKRAKKNAPRYEIETVSDFFDVATDENLDKICLEFKLLLQFAIKMRNSREAIAVSNGFTKEYGKIDLKKFTWIDD